MVGSGSGDASKFNSTTYRMPEAWTKTITLSNGATYNSAADVGYFIDVCDSSIPIFSSTILSRSPLTVSITTAYNNVPASISGEGSVFDSMGLSTGT